MAAFVDEEEIDTFAVVGFEVLVLLATLGGVSGLDEGAMLTSNDTRHLGRLEAIHASSA
jgi:hypothetical protein